MTSYDVIVVGAGITGCVTAAELQARGARVLVVDKDDVAFEASGRNMGAVGILGKHASDLAAASIPKWDQAQSLLPLPFEYQKMGRLCPAHTAADQLVLEEMRSTAREHGAAIEILSGAQVRERFPELTPGVLEAAYSAEDALVEPISATRAYAALATDRGATFRMGVRVEEVVVEQGRVSGVACDDGQTYRAPAVLVASGIWTTRLLDRLGIRIPMQFASIYHGETQPLPRAFDYFIRGPQYGARQLSDGVVRVTGGYTELGAGHYLGLHDFKDLPIWLPRLLERRKEIQFRFDPRVIRHEIAAAMGRAPAPRRFEPRIPKNFPESRLRALQAVMPALADARIVRTVAGFVDMTADALPVLDEVEEVPGLFVAAGFNGQGFGLGPVVGEVMAQSIVGEEPSQSLHAYRWDRFKDRKSIPHPPRLV